MNLLSHSLNGLGQLASANTQTRGLKRFSSEPLSRSAQNWEPCKSSGSQRDPTAEPAPCARPKPVCAPPPAGAEALKLISILGQQFLLIILVNTCQVLTVYQKLFKNFIPVSLSQL